MAATTMTEQATQLVYSFGGGDAEGGGELIELLGAKGANLHEMSRLGLRIPPGFTITTEVCRYHTRYGGYPDGLEDAVRENIAKVEHLLGRGFGDPDKPLLFSVRSGAPVSMPGMMDTVLNIGLNEDTCRGLEKQLGTPRAALDSYRRFIQMYGNVVKRIPGDRFEEVLDHRKKVCGLVRDTELRAEDWKFVIAEFLKIYEEETGDPFPTDPMEQLWQSISAVFDSWNIPRAVKWREIHNMSDDVGTAANVQAMVFGNTGNQSATGVAFTRDPATGAKPATGEFLVNAQGEDVVSGARTPQPISKYEREKTGGELPTLEELMPEIHAELMGVFEKLEDHFREMQDTEFTVEDGTLYILQTRTGKRTADAMVRIAHDMSEEGLIDRAEALRRIDADRLEQLLHPMISPEARAEAEPLAVGLGASPGGATGEVVFDSDIAEERAAQGDKVLLVRRETAADDIGGMNAAQGILTSRGGATSHAAVVARGMGKPCVAGCGALDISYRGQQAEVNGTIVRAGDWLTIDGTTGEVFVGHLDMTPPHPSEEFRTVMGWADEYRRLGVRANADTPHDAQLAIDFGAEGIGLCRTEHMFFDEERILEVRRMMLLAPDVQRLRSKREGLLAERETAPRARRREIDDEIAKLQRELDRMLPQYERSIERLLPEQREDFLGIFRAMDGYPVTIRLLDPPLHEFLPHGTEETARLAEDMNSKVEEVEGWIDRLREFNPMLGHRGCRLGITYPEIYEMQARAILEAAVAARKEGVDVRPEIMIPLVATREELARLRSLVERVAAEVLEDAEETVAFQVGTMIELPRAALTADRIAEAADFFSFGTNDLTQTAFGISRDDAGMFLDYYRQTGIVPDDPFVALDQEGVGRLVEMAVKDGRSTRPNLKCGICGEHGGEPSSVAFFHDAGLDYVSCSPYRVPVARLAAAQAALEVNN